MLRSTIRGGFSTQENPALRHAGLPEFVAAHALFFRFEYAGGEVCEYEPSKKRGPPPKRPRYQHGADGAPNAYGAVAGGWYPYGGMKVDPSMLSAGYGGVESGAGGGAGSSGRSSRGSYQGYATAPPHLLGAHNHMPQGMYDHYDENGPYSGGEEGGEEDGTEDGEGSGFAGGAAAPADGDGSYYSDHARKRRRVGADGESSMEEGADDSPHSPPPLEGQSYGSRSTGGGSTGGGAGHRAWPSTAPPAAASSDTGSGGQSHYPRPPLSMANYDLVREIFHPSLGGLGFASAHPDTAAADKPPQSQSYRPSSEQIGYITSYFGFAARVMPVVDEARFRADLHKLVNNPSELSPKEAAGIRILILCVMATGAVIQGRKAKALHYYVTARAYLGPCFTQPSAHMVTALALLTMMTRAITGDADQALLMASTAYHMSLTLKPGELTNDTRVCVGMLWRTASFRITGVVSPPDPGPMSTEPGSAPPDLVKRFLDLIFYTLCQLQLDFPSIASPMARARLLGYAEEVCMISRSQRIFTTMPLGKVTAVLEALILLMAGEPLPNVAAVCRVLDSAVSEDLPRTVFPLVVMSSKLVLLALKNDPDGPSALPASAIADARRILPHAAALLLGSISHGRIPVPPEVHIFRPMVPTAIHSRPPHCTSAAAGPGPAPEEAKEEHEALAAALVLLAASPDGKIPEVKGHGDPTKPGSTLAEAAVMRAACEVAVTAVSGAPLYYGSVATAAAAASSYPTGNGTACPFEMLPQTDFIVRSMTSIVEAFKELKQVQARNPGLLQLPASTASAAAGRGAPVRGAAPDASAGAAASAASAAAAPGRPSHLSTVAPTLQTGLGATLGTGLLSPLNGPDSVSRAVSGASAYPLGPSTAGATEPGAAAADDSTAARTAAAAAAAAASSAAEYFRPSSPTLSVDNGSIGKMSLDSWSGGYPRVSLMDLGVGVFSVALPDLGELDSEMAELLGPSAVQPSAASGSAAAASAAASSTSALPVTLGTPGRLRSLSGGGSAAAAASGR